MKKHIIYILIPLVLIIILLIAYTIISAKNPIISKIVKMDKDSITYKVRNISPVMIGYGMGGGKLQYKEGSIWVDVEAKRELYVPAIMLIMRGFGLGKDEFKVDFKYDYGELKKGEYRIEKSFFREEKEKNHINYKIYIYFYI